jgi:hypothetical protein
MTLAGNTSRVSREFLLESMLLILNCVESKGENNGNAVYGLDLYWRVY